MVLVVCFLVLGQAYHADAKPSNRQGRGKRADYRNQNDGEQFMQISEGVEAMISSEPLGPSMEGFEDAQTKETSYNNIQNNRPSTSNRANRNRIDNTASSDRESNIDNEQILTSTRGSNVGLGDNGPKMTLAKGQRLQSAVITKHTFETRPVETTFEEQEPQLIEVEAPPPELEIRFKSSAGRIKVKSFHEPGEAPGEVQETSSDEEPQRLISTIRKPIISEFREQIIPFRRVIQMINPVEETVHTIIAEGKGQRIRGRGGSSKTNSRKQSSSTTSPSNDIVGDNNSRRQSSSDGLINSVQEQSVGNVGNSESYGRGLKNRNRRVKPNRGPAARARGYKSNSSSCSNPNGCAKAPKPVAPAEPISQSAEY